MLPDGEKSIWHRAQNLWKIIHNTIKIGIEFSQWDLYLRNVSSQPKMSTAALIRNVDLHFVNVNFFLTPSRLLAPDTKFLGGIHLKKGPKLDKVK